MGGVQVCRCIGIDKLLLSVILPAVLAAMGRSDSTDTSHHLIIVSGQVAHGELTFDRSLIGVLQHRKDANGLRRDIENGPVRNPKERCLKPILEAGPEGEVNHPMRVVLCTNAKYTNPIRCHTPCQPPRHEPFYVADRVQCSSRRLHVKPAVSLCHVLTPGHTKLRVRSSKIWSQYC